MWSGCASGLRFAERGGLLVGAGETVIVEEWLVIGLKGFRDGEMSRSDILFDVRLTTDETGAASVDEVTAGERWW